ncbi:MAG: hypothetical protein JSV09_05760, partial [Thermoplasmata archaeon]
DNYQLSEVWINITGPGGYMINTTMDEGTDDMFYLNQSYDQLGEYNYTIWAGDTVGIWNFSSGSFSVGDYSPPEIANVTSNPVSQEVSGFVNITASVTDDFQLSEVWINITGPGGYMINTTMDEGPDDMFYLNQSYDLIGEYDYTIWAGDISNNWNSEWDLFGIIDTGFPQASASVFDSYWKNSTTFNILWTASDNIGLSNITLHYRYSNDNSTWGSWTEYSYNNSVSGTSASGSFEFDSPADGYYEFFTNASDTENNWEPNPSDAEAITAVDTQLPFSSIGIEPYWHTSSSLTMNIQTGDSNPSSGIADFTKYYRFSQDNISWSPWEKYEGDDREGYYEIYGIAVDNAGNVEVKSELDAMFALDNTPPVADAGEDRIMEPGIEVNLDGFGSSDNFGVISNYTWVITKDSIHVTTLYGPNPLFEIVDVGNYIVNLTVRDQCGHTDFDTVLIQVAMDSEPPEIVHLANPADQEVYGYVNITATVSDNEEVEGVWILVSDPNGNDLWNLSMSRIGLTDEYWYENFYSILGTFSYFVWAKDSSENWNVSQGSFVIKDTTLPFADAGEDLSADVNITVVFNASGSTDNYLLVNYSWNIFKYGALIANLYEIKPSIKFAENGTYEVILTVKDSSGNSASDTVMVTVNAPDSGVAPEKDHEESSNLWLLIPILIVVIAILVFIILRKRQKKEPNKKISNNEISQASEDGIEDFLDSNDEN